ncbi:MAG: primosomal protein N' [Myxococcota bacterium]
MTFAEVIVPLPVHGRFHYAIPEALEGQLLVGHRVLVPFGRRKVTGFVAALHPEAPPGLQTKEILERPDPEPMLSADLLALISFASDYYLAPQGEVLKIALPPGIATASKLAHRLTDKGKAALSAETLAAPMREILLGIKQKKPIAGASLKRMAQLLEEGLIERVDAISVKRTVEMEEIAARTSRAVVIAALKPGVERSILEALEEAPRPLSELREAHGAAGVRRALKRLLADGWVEILERPKASAAGPGPTESATLALTEAQETALAVLTKDLEAGTRGTYLLRGVTGSGKTEVYLRAIERALALKKSAIVLVPEIALTTQLESRFRARFGDQVAVLHSAMSDTLRRRHWDRLRSGEAKIALGPRSAVWAPVTALGIMVVDEEHDPSFKQQNDVRYHGRDLAIFRAHRAGAITVLGSATPSLETSYGVETGRVTELRLPGRALGRPMPAVELVDLAQAKSDEPGGEVPILSRPLADALREVVGKKEQAILFLNRRGFNTIVVCEECKTPRKCRHCDVSLTHHKSEGALVCHYCGRREPLEQACVSCRATAMKPYGAGTERVLEAVQGAAPDARVLRLDRDVTSKVGALEEVLEKFRRQEADVLVGTQMVTKGHDFPMVTLVGIVCADTSLAFPDFRAAERTFQLMTQVAGRAGRAELPGRVIIQTFDREHYALTAALAHDEESFYNIEIELRRNAGYPPIGRLGLVRIESANQGAAKKVAEAALQAAKAVAGAEVQIRGPAPAPIAKIRERHRSMLMLLAPTAAKLVGAMHGIRERLGRVPSGVDVIFDADAVDLL